MKKSRKIKIKKFILNFITVTAFVLFMLSVASIDSPSVIPWIILAVSGGWLGLYAWANGYIK